MAQKSNRAAGPQIFQANKTFLVEGNLWVRQGDTVVHGHPILRKHKAFFRPFTPTFELPEPEPEPSAEPAVEPAADADPAPEPSSEEATG